MYSLSINGARSLKNEEGCHLVAYLCPAGKLTIGYGHRIYGGAPRKITQAQADAYFEGDTRRILDELQDERAALNQQSIDALVSFIFNIGINAWRGSSALRHLYSGSIDHVVAEMSRWVHDDHGNVIPGLVARRKREIAILLGAKHA